MRKGFTLIELLAVIVILAIIALITIPAVMKIIENATMNSYRRSVDLYGKAVNNAIIEYQTDMIEKGQKKDVTFDNIESYIEYEGNEVDCKLKQIYSDKTILLTKCYVEEELVLGAKGKGYGEENYYYYTNSKKKMKIIEYIKAVEEAIKDKTINGTCTISEDKITCNGQDFTIKSNLENAIEGSIVIENNKVKSYSNLKFATEKKTETDNEVPQVVDEQNTSNENGENNNNQTLQESIATGEDYRGYYADVDGDGNPDGIIYADLNQNKSGDYYNNKVNSMQSGQYNGTYSYTKKSNLNEYTISNNTYKKNDGFGENKIIKLKKNKGNPRFYVMALEDFTTNSFVAGNRACCSGGCDCNPGTYYWYIKGFDSTTGNGRMTTYATDTSVNFGTGYTNTGKIIEIWNKNGIGEGSYSGATQDDHDIFKHIQSEYAKGWYIPSRGEWGAFADYFKKRTETGLTNNSESGSYVENSGNYNSLYGLNNLYWSSSQLNTDSAWYVDFFHGYMFYYYVFSNSYFRLGATF